MQGIRDLVRMLLLQVLPDSSELVTFSVEFNLYLPRIMHSFMLKPQTEKEPLSQPNHYFSTLTNVCKGLHGGVVVSTFAPAPPATRPTD